MDAPQRPPDPRSLPELVSQLAGDLSNLVRKESELVRTELTEKLNAAGRAAAEVAAGGVFLIAALLVLLQALVLALSHVMPAVWASVLVGVVVAVLGWVLVRAGMKAMNPKSLTPDRTARQLSKDADLLKGH